ncbi:MAG: tetratricopeptide repeat protein [Candidatus Obscuribacter sp.]|nr:tetratricopeptide repeat protein [Candidatus Obscuribacter sp.]
MMKRPVQLTAFRLSLGLALATAISIATATKSLARQAGEETTVHFQTIPGQPDFIYFDNDFELSNDEYCLPVAINGKLIDGKNKQAIEKILGQQPAGAILTLTYINNHGIVKTIDIKAPLLKSTYPEQANLEGLQSAFKQIDQYPISQRSAVNYKEDEYLGNQWDLFAKAGVIETIDSVNELPVDFKSCQNQAAAIAAAGCLRCGDLAGADKYTSKILSTLDYDHVINFYTGSQNKLIPLLVATNRLEIASQICQILLTKNLSPKLLTKLGLTEYKSGAYQSAINTYTHADSSSKLYPILAYYAQILERQKSPQLAAVADCMYAIKREYSTPTREDNALLADLYYRLGNFDRALEIYNEDLVSNLNTANEQIYMIDSLYYCHSALRVANVYSKMGKQADALSTLQSAIAYRKKLFSPQLEGNIAHNSSYFPKLKDLEQAIITIKAADSQNPAELPVDGPDQVYSYGYKNKLLMRYGQAIADADKAIKAKDTAQIEKTIMSVKQHLTDYNAEGLDYLSMDLPCAILAVARSLSDAGYLNESNSLLNYLLSNPSKISTTAPYLIRAELSINQYRKDKTLPEQICGSSKIDAPLLTGVSGYRYMGTLYLAADQIERAEITLNHANHLLKTIDWSNLDANNKDLLAAAENQAEAQIAVLLDLAKLELLIWHKDNDTAHLANATSLVDETIAFIKMLKFEMVPVSTSSYTNTVINKTYCLANALRSSDQASRAITILDKVQPLVSPVFTSDQHRANFEPIYLFSKLRCRVALDKGDKQTAMSEAAQCATLRGYNGDIAAPLLEAISSNFGNDPTASCQKWLTLSNNFIHELQGDTKEVSIYCSRQALEQGIRSNNTQGALLRHLLLSLGRLLIDDSPKEALYYFDRAMVGANQSDVKTIQSEIDMVQSRMKRDSEPEVH